MALSEEKKKVNAQALILANQTYPRYKDFITTELFTSKFGPSLKTVQEYQASWRDTTDYSEKCEEFLKFKTRTFLRSLPTDNELYAHPRFLRIITRQICNYIARYVARKDKDSDRVEIANQLYQEMHTENLFLQRKRDTFCAQHSIPQQPEKKRRARISDPVYSSGKAKAYKICQSSALSARISLNGIVR